MNDKTIIYVDAGTWGEFLRYKKKTDNDDHECIYITDETFLRGKVPGLIVRIDTFEKRWNYLPITEMIARAERDWEDFFEDYNLKKELTALELNDEDLEYGITD
jgi:heme oxygenase